MGHKDRKKAREATEIKKFEHVHPIQRSHPPVLDKRERHRLKEMRHLEKQKRDAEREKKHREREIRHRERELRHHGHQQVKR